MNLVREKREQNIKVRNKKGDTFTDTKEAERIMCSSTATNVKN